MRSVVTICRDSSEGDMPTLFDSGSLQFGVPVSHRLDPKKLVQCDWDDRAKKTRREFPRNFVRYMYW